MTSATCATVLLWGYWTFIPSSRLTQAGCFFLLCMGIFKLTNIKKIMFMFSFVEAESLRKLVQRFIFPVCVFRYTLCSSH